MYATTLVLSLSLFLRYSLANDDLIVSACEYEEINIRCMYDTRINIRKAIYCYHNTDNCCGSDYTSHIVNGLCHGKPRCHFQVNRYLFGDECCKSENNLTVYYTCEDPIPCSYIGKEEIFERFNSTASLCPKMCPSKYEQPEDCPVIEGYTCIKDYVRDRKTMTCMPEQYCPNNDEKCEKYSQCGAARQQYCPGPIVYNKNVSQDCIPGYVCDKNLYRNNLGFCVPFDECPKLRG